ncbi:hypothetical protein B0T25DRAFT_109690 [Lasiosphaeria hispida]|uniref:Uncharacterized protein n=1 Tax=Lasiosphaeria hispida TaxID=260671 RepID=A0AAJ0HRE2_9PEZI|nr:hypothetical protein B0T25DRAFT_109690 [Lasiosphaeria hispida]
MRSSHSLTGRQADSVIDDSVFLRRACHSSAVLDKWVYISGGEFSYSRRGRTTHQYSDTLVSINLSEGWKNVSVTLHATFESSGVGNLRNGGI